MSTGFIIFYLGITGLVITIIFMLISTSKKVKRERDLAHSNSNFNLRNKNEFEDYNDETVSLLDDNLKEEKQQLNSNSIFTSKYNNSIVTLKKYEEKPLQEEKYLAPKFFSKIAYEDDKTESLVDVVDDLEIQRNTQENKIKRGFCTNCGFKNEESYKFCTNCGHKIIT